jgi:hypothetical protein
MQSGAHRQLDVDVDVIYGRRYAVSLARQT